MPNPNEGGRVGDVNTRSRNLLNSAGNNANTKQSWSEWFGSASSSWLVTSWLGDKASGALNERAQEYVAAKVAATALAGTLAGISGFWVVGIAGTVVLDAVAKKVEDVCKEYVPSAVEAAQTAYGRFFFGSGTPSVVLNPSIQSGGEEHTLEDTMNRIKTNSALLQDVLNKLGGVAGKPYFCDDVYHIAQLAQKVTTTKAELQRDITLLRSFLTKLETDLGQVDQAAIVTQTEALARAICNLNDGRHWDNSWRSATIARMGHCSREHCHGPN